MIIPPGKGISSSDHAHRTSDWKKYRQRIIALHDGKCAKCGRSHTEGVTLQVHHHYYIAGRKPWEYPLDACEALCQGCHAAEHGEIPPKQGWEFHGFSDLGDLSGVCDLCGTEYRYAFMVSHPDWHPMEVGEVCCDRLTSTSTATEFMEIRRKQIAKKKRFIESSRWLVLRNDVQRIRQEDIEVEVLPDSGKFRLRVAGVRGRRLFEDTFEAKAYVFDFIESGKAREFVFNQRRKLRA